ncbi:enoyl-CoA hydratase [Janibacter sp. HTCC2649]|uniref:crotonase/enoyl-CoA hydratase family protein n=1 Tax=Janibacter sp. HTCC2649 TaxID=313589 RepID=UPI0000670A6A|nr:crotonase/enoyl-CoA hydratase family protein [Janibacter sp. HTCC2649]EAQ00587.1 enoyl-CoA hydratase [Janibacter sp. HTCC2649]
MNEPVLVEREGFVETWTLNRPEQRNPVSDGDTIEAIVSHAARVDHDPGVRAVILTGAGSAFSAGANLNQVRSDEVPFGGPLSRARNGYRHGIQQIPLALHGCEVPLIAAVNGPAIGAGFDLALLCDLRIASHSATFAESFVRVGLIPGDGGAWLLPRAIGAARAAQLTLTGASIDAVTALDWGLVSEVVPGEQLLERAHALADLIAANPPATVRMAKRLLREQDHQSLASNLELAAALQPLAQRSLDHTEAVEAMLAKRSPRFIGE